MQTARQTDDFEQAIIDACIEYRNDPYGFSLWCWPWGEKGSPLENERLEDWQVEAFEDLRQMLEARDEMIFKGEDPLPVQLAIASGHGIGKTAFLAMLQHWFLSTRPNSTGVTTANTLTQLTTKTWRELAKWRSMAINGHHFQWAATKYSVKGSNTWYLSAIPWTEHNSESFQGAHETDLLMVFDEGSNIADIIWEVVEGAMTDPGAIWVVFGNPTQATGRFRDCFEKFKRFWKTKKIDSRTVRRTNKKKIGQWEESYGVESDFFRIRVRGEFPKRSWNQLIGDDLINDAVSRSVPLIGFETKTLAVDVARYGDDHSVITRRQGRKIYEPVSFFGLNNVQLAAKVVEYIDRFKPSLTYVDGTGLGAGVVDILRELGYPVIDVLMGEQSNEPEKYYNLRAEAYAKLEEWMAGADLPDHEMLKADLKAIQYGFNASDKMQIERKEDMKDRLGRSPDYSDSLMLHFALKAPAMEQNEDTRSIMARLKETESFGNSEPAY